MKSLMPGVAPAVRLCVLKDKSLEPVDPGLREMATFGLMASESMQCGWRGSA